MLMKFQNVLHSIPLFEYFRTLVHFGKKIINVRNLRTTFLLAKQKKIQLAASLPYVTRMK